MRQQYKELFSISLKLDSPKISSPLKRTDLKEIKRLYLRAKEVFLSIPQPDESEIEEMIEIFSKGCRLIGDFFSEWRERKLQPTDEELDLLMEACEEASNNFNILGEKFPSSFPAESNKRNQEEIAKGKNFVLEEKRKRTSLNDNLQDPGQREKKINDLQSQINSFQNQPSNNDNEAKIKDLQRQIEELKKNKSIPPSVPHPEDSQQPTDNNNSLIGVFCLGFGICLALVMGYLVLSKKKKKKTIK